MDGIFDMGATTTQTDKRIQRRAPSPVFYILILVLLVGDISFSVWNGNDDTLFQPAYRLRQSIAIAISRLREPSIDGYLAHKSVVNSLSRDGLAVFPWDEGGPFNQERAEQLLLDTRNMDVAIGRALSVPIDQNLPPDRILGNEPGYADYIYLSFLLFGPYASSLYKLYIALFVLSSVVYILTLREKVPLFIISLYLVAFLFCIEYASSGGEQIASIHNSRLFGALAILPGLHIVLFLFYGNMRIYNLIPLAVQCSIFAFLCFSRSAILWQIVAIIFIYGSTIIVALFFRNTINEYKKYLTKAMSGIFVFISIIGANYSYIKYNLDTSYGDESISHTIWHNLLFGTLWESKELRDIYSPQTKQFGDQLAYDAVMNDLNRRNDRSPSIAFVIEGRIYIRLDKGWNEYEELAKTVMLNMARDHPAAVFKAFLMKVPHQIAEYGIVVREMDREFFVLFAVATILLALIGAYYGVMNVPNVQFMAMLYVGGAAFGSSLVPIFLQSSKYNIGSIILGYILIMTCVLFVIGKLGRAGTGRETFVVE